jgi:glycosyltransferase involved in cell wall biosynthesis
MIVKDESHIIADTLAHLCEHFEFSYWVISDTGSTDGTQEIIRTFFAERGIPGELTEDEWRDFGYNRTVALQHAYNKTDYLLVWDADDSIVGRIPLPQPLTNDSYMLSFHTYYRTSIVNNRKRWTYKGVLHECIMPSESTTPNQNITGDYRCVSGRAGSRNKDPQKYLKDALLLERGLSEEPDNSRYAFYCANSYYDAGKPDKALEFYKRTLSMDGWSEEKYISCLTLYELFKQADREREGLSYLVEAHKYSSNRIEHIYLLITYYCNQKMYSVALAYFNLIAEHYIREFKNPSAYSNTLFRKVLEYTFFLPYHMIIIGINGGRKDIAYNMYRIIFHHKDVNVSDWHIGNLFHNMQFLTSDTLDLTVLHDMLEYSKHLRARGFIFSNKLNIIIANHIELYRPLLTAPITFMHTNKEKPQIIFTITTCKRLDLFHQTINSILRTWSDISAVDYFLCVDDNSSDTDRAQMKTLYPWINFYMKGPDERGHLKSMNIIWQKLKELQPTYWIHMEDDWLFFQHDNYVSKSIDFLNNFKCQGIHQILFNRNYSHGYVDWDINGGKYLDDACIFTVHEQRDGIPGRSSGYWPHYSLQPSMCLVETILQLGNYDNTVKFFERGYANKYAAAGFRSGFFNTVSSKHIGGKAGENAYALNNISQF